MSRNNKLLTYGILVVLALIWGSSFILMKRGLEVFTPVQVASYRLVISGVFLLPISLPRLSKTPVEKWKYLLIVGFIGNGFPAFMFTTAQMHLDSGTTGALNALTPLFTLLVGLILFRTKVSRVNVFGVLLGLAGALMLILMKNGSEMSSDYSYGFLVMMATLFYGISVNTIHKYLKGSHPLTTASIPLLFLLIPAGIVLLSSGFWHTLTTHPSPYMALMYISILGIFGTALSLIIFNKLIQMTNALFASSVTYLMPIVALIWGWLDGEKLGIIHLLGMITIIFGIWLVNKKPKEPVL